MTSLITVPVLVAGTTAILGFATAAPASAACASGLSPVSVSTTAPSKPHVTVARTTVRKKASKKKIYVASTQVRATYGTASARITDTLCTGDFAPGALTWTYSATGYGTVTRAVTATGASRAKARTALTKRVAKAKKPLAARAKAQGRNLARATATREVTAKATPLSHVVYVSQGSGGVPVFSKSPAAGAMLINQTGGVTNLVVPADRPAQTFTCVTKAATWPTSYVVDSGFRVDGATAPGTPTVTVNNQAALNQAVVADLDASIEVDAIGLAGTPVQQPAAYLAWADDGDGNAAYEGGFNPTAVKGDLACFAASEDMPAGTVSIHGLRVGSSVVESGPIEAQVFTVTNPRAVKLG